MRILNNYDIDEWGNVYSYISNKYLKPSKVSRSVIQYHLKNKTGEWKYVQKM